MLKFCLTKNNNEINHKEIYYNNLKVNEDLSKVSGYINANENINNYDIVSITTPNISGYNDLEIEAKNVIRTGYFLKEETFNIETVSDILTFEEINVPNLIDLYVYEFKEDEEIGSSSTKTEKSVKYLKNNFYKVTKRYVKMPNGKIYYEQYKVSTDDCEEGEICEEAIYGEYYSVDLVESDGTLKNIWAANTGTSYFELENCEKVDNTLKCNICYYVENDTITYDDVDYSFSENCIYKNENDISLILYDENGSKINLGNFYPLQYPQKLTKFTLPSKEKIEIIAENINSARKFYYIIYRDKKYDFNFIDGSWQVTIINEDGEEKSYEYELPEILQGENEESIKYITYDIDEYLSTYPSSIEINDISYPILNEYRTTVDGNYLFIFTDKAYNFDLTKKNVIEAEFLFNNESNYKIYKDIENHYYIDDFGERIYLADTKDDKDKTNYIFTISKYVPSKKIDGEEEKEYADKILEEFEVELVGEYTTFSSTTSGNFIANYIDEDGNITRWSIVKEEGKRDRAYKIGTIIEYGETVATKDLSATTVVENYKFNVYRYAEIDGLKSRSNYSIKAYESSFNKEVLYYQVEYEIISYSRLKSYDLTVISNSNNWMICKPNVDFLKYLSENDLNKSDNVDKLIPMTISPYVNIVNAIITNETNFYFKDNTYGETNLPTINIPPKIVLDDDFFHLYKRINYFSFPIKLYTQTETNLTQEEILKKDFYEVEKEKAINKIIDMEKDIYYPVIDNNGFSNVKEIRFNFHLRTRDMETWKINQSTYESYSKISSENKTNDNWNIFDNYRNYSPFQNELDSDALNSSDLLYFLNFTENDVFYQKSRLGKTFIRLLFYDSIDENTQNLLHTSTVFFDESNAYRKYINNINSTSYALYYNLYGNKNEGVTYCSVNTEPLDGATINFEKDRLDCSFVIKNRNETETSSEGFYIYMFKEYGYKLRPSTIYLKVELNHAGEGKTLQFFMPTINKKGDLTCMAEDDESYEITSLTENNISKLKEGLPLNKILKSQYIKLNVKYDDKSKRYVYYVPSSYMKNGIWFTENVMTFNLWEIKFKNES